MNGFGQIFLFLKKQQIYIVVYIKYIMITYIIALISLGVLAIIMLRRTGKNEAVDFSLKCKDCGYHKGILKCTQCNSRDKWR